ncbi:MAG TPA: DNA replication and repair protein RecF [Gemmatimonadales bacterium]|nr:DNA replication and repair protein RecF [Gemmatimonadales bacterium]
MRLTRLAVRGFRNLADTELTPPPSGVVFLGSNAQGKTSLLEAIYYPVLFRSLRGAPDQELVRFGGGGFRIEAGFRTEPRARTVSASYLVGTRQKRISIDGAEPSRLAEAVGGWLAVVFLPSDVGLASGGSAERRSYLDRMLSLADPAYLGALARYRAALAQRNAALRQGRPELAAVFDRPLAEAGARVVAARLRWLEEASARFAVEFAAMGEAEPAGLAYRGAAELAEPAAWPEALASSAPRDRARGATTIGPHRDDLTLTLGDRPVRAFGSTGQVRSAAVALKLLELWTLARARGEEPALLLDDVFAELDAERQRRLAARVRDGGVRQVFLTAPRLDEVPADLGLPVWEVAAGRVRPGD